jgi:hypothetical protein
MSGVIVPKPMRSLTPSASFANFRMVRVHEAHVDQGRRLVDPAADLADDAVDDPAKMRLVVELDGASRELAPLLDVDRVGPVHHDLGDGDVGQQRLEGPEAQDVVLDLTDDASPLLGGQRCRRLLDDDVQLFADEPADELLVEGALVEARAHPLEQLDGRLLLELADRVERLDHHRTAALGQARGRHGCRRGRGEGRERSGFCRPRRQGRRSGLVVVIRRSGVDVTCVTDVSAPRAQPF